MEVRESNAAGLAPRVVDPLVLRDGAGVDFAGTLRDAGRPSGVVLVHGIVGSRRLPELDEVAAALAAEHDTLAIDVRGHGDTPGRFTWGREEWRQVDAAARYFAAGGRRVALVGFSFGGYHAVRAKARGAPADRLVLVSAPADRTILDHFPFGPAFWRHLPVMLRSSRRRRARFEGAYWPGGALLSDGEIRRADCPTLVIHGTGDWLVSRRHARRYLDLLPSAAYLEFSRGFHAEYLMASHPAELLSALRDFLGALLP